MEKGKIKKSTRNCNTVPIAFNNFKLIPSKERDYSNEIASLQCLASSSSQNLEYCSESIKLFSSSGVVMSTFMIHPFSYGLALT